MWPFYSNIHLNNNFWTIISSFQDFIILQCPLKCPQAQKWNHRFFFFFFFAHKLWHSSAQAICVPDFLWPSSESFMSGEPSAHTLCFSQISKDLTFKAGSVVDRLGQQLMLAMSYATYLPKCLSQLPYLHDLINTQHASFKIRIVCLVSRSGVWVFPQLSQNKTEELFIGPECISHNNQTVLMLQLEMLNQLLNVILTNMWQKCSSPIFSPIKKQYLFYFILFY